MPTTVVILPYQYNKQLYPFTLTKNIQQLKVVNKPLFTYQFDAVSEAGIKNCLNISNITIPIDDCSLGPVNIHFVHLKQITFKSVFDLLDSDHKVVVFMTNDVIFNYKLKKAIDNHKLYSTQSYSPISIFTIDREKGTYDEDRLDYLVSNPDKQRTVQRAFAGIIITSYIFLEEIYKSIKSQNGDFFHEVFQYLEKSPTKPNEIHCFGNAIRINSIRNYLACTAMTNSLFVENKRVLPSLTSETTTIENSSIEEDVKIGEGCLIVNSIIMKGTTINDYSIVRDSVIGWQSTIGKWCKVRDSVIGSQVIINNESSIIKSNIFCGLNIMTDIYSSQSIIHC